LEEPNGESEDCLVEAPPNENAGAGFRSSVFVAPNETVEAGLAAFEPNALLLELLDVFPPKLKLMTP